MKIVGIIPARMNSSRFPGKALADVCGCPMIFRVFNAARESGILDEIYVATDSPEISAVCRAGGIPILMTSGEHLNPTSRTAEAASFLTADYFVMIGGDEPLLHPEDIRHVITEGLRMTEKGFVINAAGLTKTEQEALDPSNIKVMFDSEKRGTAAWREARSAPKIHDKSLSGIHKFVSIGIYTQEALDFFLKTPPGKKEQEVRFDLLRFIEHGKTVIFIETKHHSLSVDTPEDLNEVKRTFAHLEKRT